MTQVGVREGYDAWAAVYDESANPLLSLERRTVAPWLPPLAGRTFVDVACGTGRWAEFAAGRGARVYGADLSVAMLARAARRLPSARGCFVLANAVRLPLAPAIADFAICALAAGYVERMTALVGELARIVRSGGKVLLTDLHPAAIESGWRRAFRRGAETYEIVNYARPVRSYLEAAEQCGLILERIAEVPFGEAERSIFRAAGREDSFAGMRRIPAVFAVLWRRP